jgi:glycosyltransferase involved in cell wall biosynthesis
MKILVSAVACNPYQGSEAFFGWSAVSALAQDHELWVLTHERNRADLTRAAKEGLVPAKVHFVYIGENKPWHPNRMRARLQGWLEYLQFSKAILSIARELHAREQFDVAHHITFTAWRVGSPLWQLDIPFIFGPICGDEEFPFKLFPILSTVGGAFELTRKVANLAGRHSPSVRQCLRGASHVFVITREGYDLASSIRGNDTGVSQLSSGFYSKERAEGFARFAPKKNVNGTLQLYAAGNLGGQKCIALALRALAQVKARGVDFRYHLGANGPEIPHLRRLAIRLGLTREIIFGGPMKREDYQRTLGETHVYLLPSMRETVGLTMMEAMLAGCVPIVADTGGPSVTVTEACGYKIPVSTANRMAAAIAEVIISIDGSREIIAHKGSLASQRIVADFSEENYRAQVNGVYARLARQSKPVL